MCFEEIIASYLLLEKISKTQENWQIENIKPLIQLKKFLVKKWNKSRLTKEEIKQKKEEFKKLNYLITKFHKLTKEEIQSYVKNSIDSEFDWQNLPSKFSHKKTKTVERILNSIDKESGIKRLREEIIFNY